jgi:hypothetical protein
MKSFLDDGANCPELPNTELTAELSVIPAASNFSESDPLYSSWLLQRIFPDRQALSEEELAALIRNDALAGLSDQLSFCPPGCEDAANQSSRPDQDDTQADLSEMEADGGIKKK